MLNYGKVQYTTINANMPQMHVKPLLKAFYVKIVSNQVHGVFPFIWFTPSILVKCSDIHFHYLSHTCTYNRKCYQFFVFYTFILPEFYSADIYHTRVKCKIIILTFFYIDKTSTKCQIQVLHDRFPFFNVEH